MYRRNVFIDRVNTILFRRLCPVAPLRQQHVMGNQVIFRIFDKGLQGALFLPYPSIFQTETIVNSSNARGNFDQKSIQCLATLQHTHQVLLVRIRAKASQPGHFRQVKRQFQTLTESSVQRFPIGWQDFSAAKTSSLSSFIMVSIIGVA